MAKQETGKTSSKGNSCPKCGTTFTSTLFINSIKTASNSYKFNRTHIKVCKCNEKVIYG